MLNPLEDKIKKKAQVANLSLFLFLKSNVMFTKRILFYKKTEFLFFVYLQTILIDL